MEGNGMKEFNKQKRYEINEITKEKIDKEIDNMENFPLTELQQSLVNYLRANIDDLTEVFGC